ncbi:MAG: hypothetical protein HOA32_01020 [Nitrospina sp.]|nr:hypothetical protein [Nitrospina sp.]MBT7196295.1 hypothetical protein [Nitrospina sp.]
MLKKMMVQIRILTVLVILGTLFPVSALSVPVEDKFDRNQAGNHPGVFPKWEGTPPLNQDLFPNLTDGINEPHPLPTHVKRDIYIQLLRIEPVNQVQSKVFNADRFKHLQRIGVLGFENKTFAPFEDKSAGDIVSRQAYQELRTNKNYSNIIPPQLMDDVRFKIVKSPGSMPDQDSANQDSGGETLVVTGDKVDAVMIGAVTKFTDRYVDRYGKIQKSISSGLEFTAFLMDPKTQEVIWGARFVGRQRPGIQHFNDHKGRWMNKKDFTRSAMKHVLKEFRNRD